MVGIFSQASSFPTRERGLKSQFGHDILSIVIVVPHAGTWIEIFSGFVENLQYGVVPHAGTWIEIFKNKRNYPSSYVVPHAGTWIEMEIIKNHSVEEVGRSPRGNVD